MTQFWIICAALLLMALAFVVLPLWRSRVRNNEVVRDAANLEIFRDQIAEMDADLANGLLTSELYEQGRQELQARVLDEVKTPGVAGLLAHDPHRKLSIAVALLMPLLAVALYGVLGNPNAFLPPVSSMAAGGFGTVRSDAALTDLQQKLAAEPGNPEGWLLLARSLAEQEKYAEAAKAYKKLTELVPDAAPMWVDYAEAVALANGESLLGEPTKLLERALKLEPDSPKGLALSGSAAMERGDYAAAVRHWEKLLKLMPKDSEDAQMVEGGLQQAREFLAQQKSGKSPALQEKIVSDGKERISGEVSLSDAVKANVSPDDTVFVVALAVSGPRMPLAVIRKQVRDLPLKFTMDDTMAMTPDVRLSKFDQVLLVARVSRSGDAKMQAGDIEGVSAPFKPGRQGIRVVIDTIVPQSPGQ
jgi:cytochrome c-type biogenesis protein CcmH